MRKFIASSFSTFSILVLLGFEGITYAIDPKNGVDGILEKFSHYRLVALAELHDNQEIWDFVEQLIDHPSFSKKVNTVTFEGGNSLYQKLMDDFISGGDIPESEIKTVWRNNTQINTTFDAPVYLRFLKHIRKLNLSLPQADKIRVILLDPPINWEKVTGKDNYLPYLMQREKSMYNQINSEVYLKNKTCLFIAGSLHVQRTKNASASKTANCLTLLEQKHKGSTFTITMHSGMLFSHQELSLIESLFEKWQKPSLQKITSNRDINYLVLKSAANFDALLYLGNTMDLTTSSPSEGICTNLKEDIQWKQTIVQRQELVNVPPFLKTDEAALCTPLEHYYFKQEKFKQGNILKQRK